MSHGTIRTGSYGALGSGRSQVKSFMEVRYEPRSDQIPVNSTQLLPFVWVFPAFRWVKFEEKVEEGGERWSKPHVSTLSLHSLFELRTCLQSGTVLLDLDGYSLPQIVGEMFRT